jgi:hypothetical protein
LYITSRILRCGFTAVDDERIAKNPCRAPSVKPPRLVSRKITPGLPNRC